MVVDFEENGNATTGLFVKVVPEKWKPVTTVRGPTEGTPFSPPNVVPSMTGPIQAYYYYPHRRWVENVNDNLAAIRFRINTREMPSDRYFGYNRDNLLMSAAVTATNTDKNVETVRKAPVTTTTHRTRETILNDMIMSPREKISKLKMMYGRLDDSHQKESTEHEHSQKKR